MKTYKIGLLILPEEYVIGFAGLKLPNASLYGFFVGSIGIGWILEYE